MVSAPLLKDVETVLAANRNAIIRIMKNWVLILSDGIFPFTRPPFFRPSMVIWSANYAAKLVKIGHFGGEPVTVPEAVIEHIKRRSAEMEKNGEFGLGPFRHGDPVRITTGPLKDLDAVFDQRLSAKGRARVFLEFLGRLTATEVNLDALEKLDARRVPRQ